MTTDSIFSVMTRAFADQSAEVIAAHCDLPIVFVGNARSVSIEDHDRLLDYLEDTMQSLRDDCVQNVLFTSRHTMSVGEALSICRVQVDRTLADGSAGDPLTETWIVRHTMEGDRLVGVVGLRLMETDSAAG